MRLRTKIALLVSAATMALGILVAFFSSTLISAGLRGELEDKGLVLARRATSQLARSIIENNTLAIQRDVDGFLEDIPDAVYGYVIGFDGEVLAHSFGEGFPSDLLSANVIPAGRPSATRHLRLGGDLVNDVGCRVIEGSGAEVHIGLSEKGITGKVSRLRRLVYSLSLAILLVGICAALYVTTLFTRPLETLSRHAADFGMTGRYRELPVKARDEVGELTRAFNLMAGNLTASLARMRESEQRYRELVELAREGIAATDGDFRLVFANRRLGEMLGRARDELIGRPAASFIDDETKEGFASMLDRMRGGGSFQFETVLARAGGGKVHVLVSSAPLSREGDEFNGCLVMVTDIDDRIRAERELRLAKDDLERQNVQLRKVDKIKDGLIRDVTHELKTPVAKISMQLELLKAFLAKRHMADDSWPFIDVMERSIQRQHNVIRNILNLARLEEGGRARHLEPVSLDRLLESVLEDYREALEGNAVVVKKSLAPVTIASDPEMLWHVFSNIVNNAIKFRRGDVPSRIGVRIDAGSGAVTVRIADNGIGMAPEETARAFDRFYQASASVEGSGVGLTIVKLIVEDLGGTILLESPGPGRGTTVSVTFPYVLEQGEGGPPPAPAGTGS